MKKVLDSDAFETLRYLWSIEPQPTDRHRAFYAALEQIEKHHAEMEECLGILVDIDGDPAADVAIQTWVRELFS